MGGQPSETTLASYEKSIFEAIKEYGPELMDENLIHIDVTKSFCISKKVWSAYAEQEEEMADFQGRLQVAIYTIYKEWQRMRLENEPMIDDEYKLAQERDKETQKNDVLKKTNKGRGIIFREEGNNGAKCARHNDEGLDEIENEDPDISVVNPSGPRRYGKAASAPRKGTNQ